MKNILLLSGALMLAGCAGRLGHTGSTYDKVEAVQIEQLSRNNLTKTPFDQKVVYLNARCETKPDGKKDYFLFTEVIAPAEFTLQSSDSLILNVDGQIFSYSPTNAPTGVNGRKRYTTTFYKVQPEVLTKLSGAKEARVRIKGTNMVIDKRLSRRNLTRFHEFAHKCSIATAPSDTKNGG